MQYPRSYEPVIDLLERVASCGEWAPGYQIAVDVAGEVVLNAAGGEDGSGMPIDEQRLVALYCAGKPALAVLVGRLVDLGELSFDDKLGDLIEAAIDPTIGSLSVEEVLSHRAGLGGSDAASLLVLSPDRRRQAVLGMTAQTSGRGVSRYSEYLGWELLSIAMEHLTRRSFDDLVAEHLRADAGIDMWFRIETGNPAGTRIALNADIRGETRVPILWERSRSNLLDIRPASGGYANMNSLRSLYRLVLNAAKSGTGNLVSQMTAREMIEPLGGALFDPVLNRTCRFSRGFMYDLREHGFSAAHHTSSFGHTGLSGMTVAGADPRADVCYAIHLNGLTEYNPESNDPLHRPDLRRSAIVDLVLNAASCC